MNAIGAVIFSFKIEDQLNAPATITVVPYGNWKVATGLPAVAGSPNTFRADNFDILYDSPFEVSDFKEVTFEVQGKKHRYVVTGEGNYDLNRLAADTAKIVEESYKIFGELPYDKVADFMDLVRDNGAENLGIAFDINVASNAPGTRPDQDPRLVEIMEEHGFTWGGRWLIPDGMHFEYRREPAGA